MQQSVLLQESRSPRTYEAERWPLLGHPKDRSPASPPRLQCIAITMQLFRGLCVSGFPPYPRARTTQVAPKRVLSTRSETPSLREDEIHSSTRSDVGRESG